MCTPAVQCRTLFFIITEELFFWSLVRSRWCLRPDACPRAVAQHRLRFSLAQKNVCFRLLLSSIPWQYIVFFVPQGKNVTFFQFAKTKNDGTRPSCYMVYISEPRLLVTTQPEGTWPLLFFCFVFFFIFCIMPEGTWIVFLRKHIRVLQRERDCQCASGSMSSSFCKSHTPTQSPLHPVLPPTLQHHSIRQTVVRGCKSGKSLIRWSTSKMVISH